MKKIFQPKSLTLQWHITERCNWRCKHCYQENYETPEMNLEQMEKFLAQFIALVKKWNLPKNRVIMYLTGGEPFIRNDFLSFLKIVNKYSDSFRWTVLSNGSLLTEGIAESLKKLGITNFQLSLEGLEKTNDEIRGYGSFQKILRAIKILDQAKIPIRVSLTLCKQNYKEIRELALQLAPLGVARLAVRRIASFGSRGNQLNKLVLEPLELRNVYQEIEKTNIELKEKKYALKVSGGCENAVFNDEISSPDLMSYEKCGVIEGNIITLLPDGDVLICRRFPMKIGNVLTEHLEEIYYSPLYESFRGENEDVPLECYPCPNQKSCSGGAKCVTYALTGKTTPDVQCWKLFESLKESTVYLKHHNWFKKFLLLLKMLKSSNFPR
jgi:radical SAM protein with 4Fe4S-binding SPASM domain